VKRIYWISFSFSVQSCFLKRFVKAGHKIFVGFWSGVFQPFYFHFLKQFILILWRVEELCLKMIWGWNFVNAQNTFSIFCQMSIVAILDAYIGQWSLTVLHSKWPWSAGASILSIKNSSNNYLPKIEIVFLELSNFLSPSLLWTRLHHMPQDQDYKIVKIKK